MGHVATVNEGLPLDERDPDPTIEAAKQRARRRIFAVQYLTLADKYFGCGMDREARRCYLQAARYRPDYLVGSGALRRLVGTALGRHNYDAVKMSVRRVLAN
jgi:hypothetical protein